jgi:hypothetical protein
MPVGTLLVGLVLVVPGASASLSAPIFPSHALWLKCGSGCAHRVPLSPVSPGPASWQFVVGWFGAAGLAATAQWTVDGAAGDPVVEGGIDLRCPAAPVQLVNTGDGGSLILLEPALRVLQQLPPPLYIMAAVGKFRCGKSTVSSLGVRLNHGASACPAICFEVAGGFVSKTRGVWMSAVSAGYVDGKLAAGTFIFLDTEGLFDAEQDPALAQRMFILTTLLASSVRLHIERVLSAGDLSFMAGGALLTKLAGVRGGSGLGLQPASDLTLYILDGTLAADYYEFTSGSFDLTGSLDEVLTKARNVALGSSVSHLRAAYSSLRLFVAFFNQSLCTVGGLPPAPRPFTDSLAAVWPRWVAATTRSRKVSNAGRELSGADIVRLLRVVVPLLNR